MSTEETEMNAQDQQAPVSSSGETQSGSVGDGAGGSSPQDLEVLPRPKRRRFKAAYKLRILTEVEACTGDGDVGRLLRREGLYSSHLTEWRKARDQGALAALSKKRGRPKKDPNPLAPRVRQLERELAKTQEKLRRAELVIEVQGKVAGLLGLTLSDGKSS